jgi:hypothetical protein
MQIAQFFPSAPAAQVLDLTISHVDFVDGCTAAGAYAPKEFGTSGWGTVGLGCDCCASNCYRSEDGFQAQLQSLPIDRRMLSPEFQLPAFDALAG